METKSRYEVIAELETKKRDLIKERDSLNDELRKKELYLENLMVNKEKVVKDTERKVEDLEREKRNSEKDFARKLEDFERAKEDRVFDFEKKTKDLSRQKEDFIKGHDTAIAQTKNDINAFKATIIDRKATIQDLIKSVDESLERFGRVGKEKS